MQVFGSSVNLKYSSWCGNYCEYHLVIADQRNPVARVGWVKDWASYNCGLRICCWVDRLWQKVVRAFLSLMLQRLHRCSLYHYTIMCLPSIKMFWLPLGYYLTKTDWYMWFQFATIDFGDSRDTRSVQRSHSYRLLCCPKNKVRIGITEPDSFISLVPSCQCKFSLEWTNLTPFVLEKQKYQERSLSAGLIDEWWGF